jgi:hypothetical protein
MSDSFGLIDFIMILLNGLILILPIFIVWYLIKTLRRITRQNETIGREVNQLREEIRSLRELLPGDSKK